MQIRLHGPRELSTRNGTFFDPRSVLHSLYPASNFFPPEKSIMLSGSFFQVVRSSVLFFFDLSCLPAYPAFGFGFSFEKLFEELECLC